MTVSSLLYPTKVKQPMRIAICNCCFFFLHSFALFSQTTIYVNQNVQGGQQNGATWAYAFSDLQSAISLAKYGDEIWVASGTYLPTSTTDRSLSFEMKNGVKMLGGFNGTEVSANQRDIKANPTRLSGNISDTASNTDNSYHVLRGKGLDDNSVLDGIIISDGYSLTGPTFPYSASKGAGLYILGGAAIINSKPVIANCLFEKNLAGGTGGAMYISSEDPDGGSGGGFYIAPYSQWYTTSILLDNCVFRKNTAPEGGGFS